MPYARIPLESAALSRGSRPHTEGRNEATCHIIIYPKTNQISLRISKEDMTGQVVEGWHLLIRRAATTACSFGNNHLA